MQENPPTIAEECARPEILRRHRSLLGRTALVSALTLASRILGFVREVVTAIVFGDGSAISDAFFTAWRVPNLLRRLFGEGALSTSLQTVLTETDGDDGPVAGRRLFGRTVAVATGVLVVVCMAGMLLVGGLPDRMPITGWLWLGADPEPVRDLCVRLFPYVVLVCVAALCGGALQVRGHFTAPNVAPAVMNVCWIGALVAVAVAFAGAERGSFEVQWRMARWVAWGVLVGGVVQLAVMVPPLFERGLLPRRGDPRPERHDPEGPSRAAQVLWTSLPLALGAAVYQVNVLLDGLMAEGLLTDGGPTALYYANRIQQFPLALVATATVSAIFPSLKAHAHLGEHGEVRRLHARAQLGILFLALPAAVGLWVLAAPIAQALFEHGSYGPAGTARITATLEMLALALVPAGAAGLVSRTFIALGDVRTPVRVAIVFLVVNAFLNVALVRGLGLDVEGLALATALSSWGTLLALGWLLGRRLGREGARGELVRRTGAIVLAAAACGGAAWAAAFGLPWIAADAWRATVAGSLAGLVAFLAAARALDLEEWRELAIRLRRRSGGG